MRFNNLEELLKQLRHCSDRDSAKIVKKVLQRVISDCGGSCPCISNETFTVETYMEDNDTHETEIYARAKSFWADDRGRIFAQGTEYIHYSESDRYEDDPHHEDNSIRLTNETEYMDLIETHIDREAVNKAIKEIEF